MRRETAVKGTVAQARDAVLRALGDAATLNVGTTAGTVKAGDWQPAAADVTDASAAGRALLTGADAAVQRAALGVDWIGNSAVSSGAKVVAFMGDSITIGNATQFNSYPQWFGILANHQHTIINKGVIGDNTTQMLARFDADIIAATPAADYVVINGGKNDISAGVSLATVQANLVAMVERARFAGIKPILSTIIQYGNDPGGPAFTATQKADTDAANTAIRSYALSNRIPLVDYAAATTDPNDGWARPEYMLRDDHVTSDNLHPNRAGKLAMVSALLPLFDRFELPADPAGNLLANPTFAAVTGGIPNSWDFLYGKSAGMTFTPTLHPNKWGAKTLKVVTASPNTTTEYGYITQAIASGWAVGDTLTIEADLMVTDYVTDSTASTDAFMVRIRYMPSNTSIYALFTKEAAPQSNLFRFKASGVVPAGTTGVSWSMGWNLARGTFYIARPNIYKSA